MGDVRVTQEVVEAVSTPTPSERVTQLVVESVATPAPSIRVTQVVVETITKDPPVTDLVYADQVLWEVAVNLDTVDPNPTPIPDPAGGGSGPFGVNPDEGINICGADSLVAWWEVEQGGTVIRRDAPEAINLDSQPKEGRVLTMGQISRALSNQFSDARGANIQPILADDDRALRNAEISDSLIGARASAYISSRAAIINYRDTANVIYKPRRVFDGKIVDSDPQPELTFQLTVEDFLTYILRKYKEFKYPKRVFSLDDFPNMGNSADSDSPGNPTMVGKSVPVGYGLLSDEQALVPQGVVPFVYTGQRALTNAFEGQLFYEFVAFGHPAGWRGSLFVPSGGGLSTGTSYPSRVRITPASGMADWIFPGTDFWTAEFGATNYRVFNGRAYEVVYGIGSSAYLAATSKVPLCGNYGGFTDGSNGSGNVLTSLKQQFLSLLANWVFGDYESGAPLDLPTVGSGGDLYSRIDTDSLASISDVEGAFIIGANGEGWTLDQLMTQFAVNLHAEYGVNRNGQIFWTQLDLTPVINRTVRGLSDVEQRSFKTKRHRELVKNVVKWQCGRRYVQPFTQGTPEEGALMPVSNVMPSTEWITDNQQLPAGTPPTSASITKYDQLVESVSFEMIRDPVVAEGIAQKILDENETAPIYTEFVEGPCGTDTDLGDVDTVDHYDALTESGRNLRCEKHTLDLDTFTVKKDCRDVT